MSMNILNDISQVYIEQVASKPDFLDLDKDGNKKEPMKKAAKEVEPPKERLKTDRNMFSIPKDEQKAARERLLAKARAKRKEMGEELEVEEVSYSAKSARAGKDIGKPGKLFAKIAKSAAEKYGSEERGIKVAGKVLAKLRQEALDPVGEEDDDIDNDNDTDKSDKYLLNRRKAIGKAIKKKVEESNDYDPMDDDEFDHDEAENNRGVSGKNNPKGGKTLGKKKSVKEGFSNWREDLSEVMSNVESDRKIKEKKVKNKIKINPEMQEAVENLGGELIEMVEIDEGMTMKDFKQQRSRQKQKEKRAADKIAPNRRKDIHTDKYSPERAARHRANVDPDFEGNDERNYPGGKLNPKKVRKAKALGELGEENQLDEIAPLAAGALAAGALAAPYLLKKFAKPKVDKALDTETQRIQKNRGLTQMNSYELEGEVLDEKATSEQQQKLFGLALSVKRGQTPRSEVSDDVLKIVDTMSEKKIRDFAKTKHEGIPKKVEEAVTGGSTPNLPSQVVKFVDELPQNIQKTFAKVKPTQKSPSKPIVNKEELEIIDERRREDKGTPRPQRDRALEVVKGMLRQQMGGKPSGQRKKVPGKKPPAAGQFGSERKSPAQQLKIRKAQQQRSQEWQQDTKGT